MTHLQGQPEHSKNYAGMFLINMTTKTYFLVHLSVRRAPNFPFIASTIRRYDARWNEIQFKTSVSEGFIKDTEKNSLKNQGSNLREENKSHGYIPNPLCCY